MSFNRNKSLAKVQKLLQKGKNNEAIDELKLVVEDDPSDVRNTLRLGDLYAKVGNIGSACEIYHKVGEHYAKDGFFLKAVAVFKQILKLDPALIRVYLRLAELYQQLGLNSEAMKQYQVVVKHYENQGLKKESLDILRKMAELDPENTASRVKLAELYAREGHQEASQEQFKSVAGDLLKKNNFQDLARVYEKMETLNLVDDRIRIDLSELYLKLAEPKRALSKLQEVFKNDAKNPAILELLARTFVDLQQPEKAKSVYSELIQVLDSKGMALEKDRITAKLRALGGTVAPSSSLPPAAEATPRSAPRETASTTSSPEFKPASAAEAKVLQEVEVFLKYGLLDKACQMLSHAVTTDPDKPHFRAKLIEAYKLKNDTDGLVAVLTRAVAVADKAGKAFVGQSLRKEIENLGTNAQSSSQAAPAEAELVAEPLDAEMEVGDPVELEIVDDVPEVAEAAPAPQASVAPSGSESVEFERSELDELSLNLDLPESHPENIEPEISVEAASAPEFSIDVDLSMPEEAPLGEPEAPPLSEAQMEREELNLDLSDIDLSIPAEPPRIAQEKTVFEPIEPVAKKAKPAADTKTKAKKTKFAQAWATEMDEADFFISQGLLEEAKEVYQTILGQDPTFQPALEKFAELKGVKPAPPARTDGTPERRQTTRTAKPSLEAEEEVAKPASKKEAGGDFYDLTSELQDEIQDLESQFGKKTKAEGEEDYLSPEEVITEFKKGVSRTVARDDHQTHYNLGIAYKEMGLLNEAIHEFEIASEDPKMTGNCASMIGLCLIGKKDYQAAIDVYRKALGRTSPQSEESLGLNYELAEAYIGNGNLSEAYKLFARIRDVDPTFRDARRRAKELEADLGASAPPASAPEKKKDSEESLVKIAGKKNKISYI